MTDQSFKSQQTPDRLIRHRFWGRFLAAVGVSVASFGVIAAVAIWAYLPRYVEHIAKQSLHEIGFTPAQLTVADWSLEALTFQDLRIGPQISIDTVHISFDLSTVWQSGFALDVVRISGVRIDLPRGTDDPVVAKLLALAEGQDQPDQGPISSPRVAEIHLSDAVLEATLPQGVVRVSVESGTTFFGGIKSETQFRIDLPLGLPSLGGQVTLNGTQFELTADNVASEPSTVGDVSLRAVTENIFDPLAPVQINASTALDLEALNAHWFIPLSIIDSGHITGQVKATIAGSTTIGASMGGQIPDLSFRMTASDVVVPNQVSDGAAFVDVSVAHIGPDLWQLKVLEAATASATVNALDREEVESLALKVALNPGSDVKFHLPSNGHISAKGQVDVDVKAIDLGRLSGQLNVYATPTGISVSKAQNPQDDCLILSFTGATFLNTETPEGSVCLQSMTGPIFEWSPESLRFNTRITPFTDKVRVTAQGQSAELSGPLEVLIRKGARQPDWRFNLRTAGLRYNSESFFQVDSRFIAVPVSFAGAVSPNVDRVSGVLTIEVGDPNAHLRLGVNARTSQGRRSVALDVQPYLISPDKSAALQASFPSLLSLVRPETGRLTGSIVTNLEANNPEASVYLDGRIADGRVQVSGAHALMAEWDDVIVRGPVKWNMDRRTDVAGLDVLVRDATLNSDFGRVQQITGVVHVDSLSPLRTAAQQTIAIALIEAGILLPDGVITFQHQDTVTQIESARWSFAGGVLSAEDIRIRGGELPSRMTLVTENLDLEHLLSTFGVEGVEAEGAVSGRIPIIFKDDRLSLDGGLASTKPGVVKFNSGYTFPGLPLDAADTLAVLNDFRYDTLQIGFGTQPESRDLILKVRLLGRNPTYQNGRLVDLNIHLEGDLEGVAKAALNSYDLPERIAGQIYDFPESADGPSND